VVQFVHFGDSQTETPAWTSPVDLPTGSCPAPYTYTAFGNHSFSYITGNVEVERSGYSWPIH
jgi:hypothetical protein